MLDRLRRLLARQEDSLAVQSIILTAARVAGFAVAFSIPIVLVRLFDQEEFGIYKQVFLIAGSIIPVFNLGMAASLFYFIPRDDGEGQRFLRQAVILLSITGAIAGLLLIFGAPLISQLLNTPSLQNYLPLLGLFVFIAIPSRLVFTAPVVDRRPALAGLTMSASDLARASLIIMAAVLFRSLTAVLWAVILAAAVHALWLIVYMRWRRTPDASAVNILDFAKQLRYALPFSVAVIFQTGLQAFHQYYVAASLSAAEFAVYAIGVLQIPVLGMLVHSVVEVMLIRVSAAHKVKDLAEMTRVWGTTLERLAVIVVPSWVLAELVAPDLIVVLFGPAYAGSVLIFRIFVIAILLMMIVDHGILRATGDTPYLLVTNVVGFIASVVAVVALARFSMLLGGVIGYVLGVLVMRAMGLAMVARRLGVSFARLLPWVALARVGLAAAISAGVAATGLTLELPILRLAAVIGLFCVAYTTIVLYWDLLPREELRMILNKLRFVYR